MLQLFYNYPDNFLTSLKDLEFFSIVPRFCSHTIFHTLEPWIVSMTIMLSFPSLPILTFLFWIDMLREIIDMNNLL